MAEDDFTIEHNPGLESAVEGSDFGRSNALEVAQEIAAAWRDAAPVGDGDTAGDYRDGIIAIPTEYGAMVKATDFVSGWEEFGVPAHGIPGKFIGRKAVLGLGLKFAKGRER
ncbi:MAG: hypothetical protein ABIP33_06460 [Pseudolysinimonas sp.]